MLERPPQRSLELSIRFAHVEGLRNLLVLVLLLYLLRLRRRLLLLVESSRRRSKIRHTGRGKRLRCCRAASYGLIISRRYLLLLLRSQVRRNHSGPGRLGGSGRRRRSRRHLEVLWNGELGGQGFDRCGGRRRLARPGPGCGCGCGCGPGVLWDNLVRGLGVVVDHLGLFVGGEWGLDLLVLLLVMLVMMLLALLALVLMLPREIRGIGL